MGSSTRSNKNYVSGEKEWLSNRGKDMEDVTERFQLHDCQLIKRSKVKLSYHDKFFREAFSPMYLMNFKLFNNILDKFLLWVQKTSSNPDDHDFELVPYDLFIQFFQADTNHLWQMFNEMSPMRLVLMFDNVFLMTKKMEVYSREEEQIFLKEADQEFFEVLDMMPDLLTDQQKEFVSRSVHLTATQFLESNTTSGKLQKEKLCIDLFCVRILSLVICRGKPREKASLLANIANLQLNQPVDWKNKRMVRALKLIVYFSSILPDKFLSLHQDHPVFNQIMSKDQNKLRGARKKKIAQENFDQAIFEDQNFWLENDTGDYDYLFDDVFNKILTDDYLDQVFPRDQSEVSHKEFVKRFSKPMLQGDQEWSLNNFFSPKKVCKLFKNYLEQLQKRQLIRDQPKDDDCFEIVKIDWSEERNSIINLDSDEDGLNFSGGRLRNMSHHSSSGEQVREIRHLTTDDMIMAKQHQPMDFLIVQAKQLTSKPSRRSIA